MDKPQAAVPFQQVLQLLELTGVLATVIRLPLVEPDVADPVLPALIGHIHVRLMQIEDGDDRVFRELALSHGYGRLNVAPGRPKGTLVPRGQRSLHLK